MSVAGSQLQRRVGVTRDPVAWISRSLRNLPARAAGRIFAWLVVLAPAGLLFHAAFREEVVLPFMKACGAV